ncbi:MAG TPA: hypothetical protein VNB59_05465 [Solirubrobacterales bacterium]|jgi:hypothetical protein|nr:hypothetical protein [Solirubrobacterales bacterium]
MLTEGFQTAFLIGAGFAVLGFVATLLLIRSADSRAHAQLGRAGDGNQFVTASKSAALSGRRRVAVLP